MNLGSTIAWEIVEQDDNMNGIQSTWYFKCKRYLDGLLNNFKARFCASSNHQLEVTDFFDTCALVVQCTTV